MKIPNSCRDISALLLAREDRSLSAGERLAVRVHILTCRACQRFDLAAQRGRVDGGLGFRGHHADTTGWWLSGAGSVRNPGLARLNPRRRIVSPSAEPIHGAPGRSTDRPPNTISQRKPI